MYKHYFKCCHDGLLIKLDSTLDEKYTRDKLLNSANFPHVSWLVRDWPSDVGPSPVQTASVVPYPVPCLGRCPADENESCCSRYDQI